MKPIRQLFIVAAMVPAAFAQLPSGAALRLTHAPAGSTVRLALSDPENHSYLIQSSPDLVRWSDVGTWKIHNGGFNRNLPLQAGGGLFYR
ncbi:MAG: hypothetical protein EOO72_11935, partial [Myxococcaceae bacterium]